MTDLDAQNPFAPPRAAVVDAPAAAPAAMVPASRWVRLGAEAIDVFPAFLIGGGVAVAAYVLGRARAAGAKDTSTDMGIVGLVALAVALVWLAWNIVLLHRHGQTLGKRLLGLRVVRTDGSRVRLLRFFFLRWLPITVIGVSADMLGKRLHLSNGNLLVAVTDGLFIFRASRRCLHDLFAGTLVVTAASSPDATLAGSRRLPAIRF